MANHPELSPPVTLDASPPARPSIPASITLADDPDVRHNVRMESVFSAFNGVLLGLAVIAVRDIAAISVDAHRIELTLLVAAFPVGAFLGPLWAYVGRRLGMKRLVTGSACIIGALLLCMTQARDATLFTVLLIPCQLLCIAMRMGQASLYGVLYPRALRGRALSRFVFWTYLTMVPSLLLAGWLLKLDSDVYRLLYPVTGACAFLAAFFYQRIRIPQRSTPEPPRLGGRDELRKVGRILQRDRAFRLFEVGFFLSGSSFLMSTHLILMLVRDRFGLNPFELILWLTVIPQLLLALGSFWWGRAFDRLGMTFCRLLVCIFMTLFLACYFIAFVSNVVKWIYLGSLFQGMTLAGAQLTWFLASSYFAEDPDDVASYNTIHFFLNGVRGLLLPLTGTILLVWLGVHAILVAVCVSAAAIPLVIKLRPYDRRRNGASSCSTSRPLSHEGDNDDHSHVPSRRRSGTDADLQRRGGAPAESQARLAGGNQATHVGGRL